MSREKEQEINVPIKGLYTDSSYLNQPPGTYTFALNAVNVTNKGDEGWRANEESNEQCCQLPNGYIPLGKVRISNGEQVIFSVSADETLSEIGIVNNNCGYTSIVNGNLGFKINKQISVSYRLRRGCERTLYFSTPTPMSFNLDAPEDYKTETSPGVYTWDKSKFKLFKIYEQIPSFEKIEVLENGAIPPGSINAAIQYLDTDLNPTEWITTCEPIKIYNDLASDEYYKIRGSINQANDINNYGLTNKSVKFTFGNFDPSYPFYRVAIIASTSGTGQITSVNYSSPISTEVKTFTYSGLTSFAKIGTEEEIIAFNNIIEEAKYIEQIENRLIIGNTKGMQVNFCNLQKYASKIKADLEYKTVKLNTISPSNPKTPTINFDGTGYMPGEIYSFGIVYIFDDSSLSPVYHIPGRAVGYSSQMSSNNTMEDVYYHANDSCIDYWGVDSQGVPLDGKLVRHHRFPTRGEVNKPLYTQINSGTSYNLKYLYLKISNEILGSVTDTTIGFRVVYKIGLAPTDPVYEYKSSIVVATYKPNLGVTIEIASNISDITVQDIYETVGGIEESVGILGEASTRTGLSYLKETIQKPIIRTETEYNAEVMSITFSGIEAPPLDVTNNHKIVGYYIVRNERDEDNKTILDSGILTPMLDTDLGYVAHGYMFPQLADPSPIKLDTMALIHPEHKFKDREYKNATSIIQEGYYAKGTQMKSVVLTQDVGTGTSYNPDIHKKSSADYDGYSLRTVTRDTNVTYVKEPLDILTPTNSGKISYLKALNYRNITDSDNIKQQVYNISGDNKVGIINLDEKLASVDTLHDKLPYVILKRDLGNPYGNFQVLPYFKENVNPVYFVPGEIDPVLNGSTKNIFNGDSYITPMRYHSAVFYNFRLACRSTKSGTWKIIVGALEVVAGAAAIIIGLVGGVFTAGAVTAAAIGAGVSAIGAGISTISSGVELNTLTKVYNDTYEAGLRETIVEDDVIAAFGQASDGSRCPEDDEFQWLHDVVTNLWFESNINIGLRFGITAAITDFLDSPDVLANAPLIAFPESNPEPQNLLDFYALEKLTTIDTDNGDGRLYKGYAGAEVYFHNPDYGRTNKQKVFYTLGLEYDCCSNCSEDFPHRVWYSEQSFQEELTDNFRTFLPNNYRDIEGEKGVITDIFRIKNNLFIQTEEATWHLPQNIQERVTGDVVSFIGTGSFFSIPPRLIEDSDLPSAGTTHNWARVKTNSGVLFVSETDRKIYLFDGQTPVPISSIGNSIWFKNNMKINADATYRQETGSEYPFKNNPSNKYGTGYISAYDTAKERLIITKKDFVFNPSVIESDTRVTMFNDTIILFRNFTQTIQDKFEEGWTYEGIVENKLKFSKVVFIELGGNIEIETQIDYVEGLEETNPILYDLSWTISYSLKDKSWIGWHSYLPNFYMEKNEVFYSWINGNNYLWKHNKPNHYQTFYGKPKAQHIIEIVNNFALTETKLTDYITLKTEAQQYNSTFDSYVDKDITFNKLWAYNSKQLTGELTLVPKIEDLNYLSQQVVNTLNSIIIEKVEQNWHFNDLRDIVIDYTVPLFKEDSASISTKYYIDKIINSSAISVNKDWYELQSLRDKYLVLRFIFDNFDNTRLITNYTKGNEIISHS
jgi:hypothetical protein